MEGKRSQKSLVKSKICDCETELRMYLRTGLDTLQTHYRLHMWHKARSLECNQTCQPCPCVCVHACVMHW